MSKLFVFIIVKAISYHKYSTNLKISRYFFIPLLSFPISTALILYAIANYTITLTEKRPAILIACASILLIVSNLLLFYLFEKQLIQEEEKHHSQLVQQQLEYQADYFRELADKHKFSNKTIHNLKNQLFAISILLSNTDPEKIAKARKKVDELCSNVFNDQTISHTGNDALDALINSKYQTMIQSHILFTQSIFINSVNQIDDIDLCIIMGNALDNAIEACMRIDESSPRKIDLKIMQIENYLTIEIQNTIAYESNNQTIIQIGNGKIATSKGEKALHGFGLQSMRDISNIYGGYVNYSIINDLFILKIYMNNKISDPNLQK